MSISIANQNGSAQTVGTTALSTRILRMLLSRPMPHRIIARMDGFWQTLLDYLPILAGHVPSHNARLRVYRWLGAETGEHTSIHRSCEFCNIPELKIAENSVINRHVVLDARSGLTIGRNVSISEYAIIYSL